MRNLNLNFGIWFFGYQGLPPHAEINWYYFSESSPSIVRRKLKNIFNYVNWIYFNYINISEIAKKILIKIIKFLTMYFFIFRII